MVEENTQKKVSSYFWPPSLILRQLGSILLYGSVTQWHKLSGWFFKYGFKTLPIASGAYGMGCIGFPAHPVWEITLGCNFRCIHCHASSREPHPDELTTEEALKLVEEIASIKEFRMLVLTGGEPLTRKDIFEILDYGRKLGLKFVIATNATLITEEVAFRLKESRVVAVAVSIDSSNPQTHNFIRNNSWAFSLAMRGMENIKKARITLQVNFTAMQHNAEQLRKTIDFVNDLGANIMLVYQLVPVGRGKEIKGASLESKENQNLARLIKEKQATSTTIIEPVANPQYWPYLLNGQGRLRSNMARLFFHGCTAGRGLVYIKANGQVWPCPFIGVSGGNVRKISFPKIWRESKVFQNLRQRKLKGKCGECRYIKICGGCRGRAWAIEDDYLSEDPSCFIMD